MNSNTLQVRMTLLLVVFSFFSAAIVGGVSTYMSVAATRESSLSANQTIASQLSNQVERFMADHKGLIEALALSPTAYSMDPGKIREMVRAVKLKNPEFQSIYVMNTAGMQIAKTSDSRLDNKADKEYFKKAMEGNTFLSDSYISAVSKLPTITISTPIKDATGTIRGVLAGDISLKAVQEIAEKTAIGKFGYIDIVDQKGTLLAHPNQERVLKTENISQEQYVQDALSSQIGRTEAVSTTGVESLIVFAPVENYQWGVITYLPKSEIDNEVKQNVLVMAVLIVIAVILASITAFYVAKGISKPIEELAVAAEKMADGDFRQNINPSGLEEVKQLALSLDKMRESLKTIIRRIAASAEQVAAFSEELNTSAEQTAQATTLVATVISEVAQGTDKQVAAVDTTTAVVEQMSAGIQQVAANANSVTGMSDKTAGAAQLGNKSIDEVASQMNSIEGTVVGSAQAVAKLGERSKEIGQIVETISGLAGQTNLLALNAAIEAARAGEQGRGFAVVAEEVRKLAEQSQAAAKQIAQLINEVQTETDKAVVAMEEGTREVKVGTEVVNNAGQAFGEIAALIDQVSGQVKEISAAMQQMASGSQQIVASVRDIDRVSKETAGKTQTVSAATQEQAASMEQIAASSQSLAKMADELQNAVRMFKI